MEIVRSKSVHVSLLLSIIAALLVIFFWEFVIKLALHLNGYLAIDRISMNWWSFLLLVGVALAMGYLTEKFSVKRILKVAIPFILIWTAALIYSIKSMANFSKNSLQRFRLFHRQNNIANN